MRFILSLALPERHRKNYQGQRRTSRRKKNIDLRRRCYFFKGLKLPQFDARDNRGKLAAALPGQTGAMSSLL